jgi:hypothetical protein
MASSELPLALMAAAQFRNDKRLWLGLLAYLLRHEQSIKPETIDRILGYATKARKQTESGDASRRSDLGARLTQARTRCYRSFLARPEQSDDDARNMGLNQVSWITLGDMALGAELTEVAAFSCLCHGEEDRARGFFDTAASFYYLTGLWNAGRHNEWASSNISRISRTFDFNRDGLANFPTLCLPLRP